MRGWAKWLFALFAVLLLILCARNVAPKTFRSLVADEKSAISVRTSLGYSTILEFPSKPTSAVLGDQDAFKIEYVGNSLTIKPLFAKAQSNLFVFTEYGRFNCELHTVPASQVDYIVQIRERARPIPTKNSLQSKDKPHLNSPGADPLVITRIEQSATYDGYTLKVVSISRERKPWRAHGIVLIDFELQSSKKTYAFQSASIGIKQGSQFLQAESLYLETLHLTPGNPAVRGKLALLAQDIQATLPLSVAFAVPQTKAPKKSHLLMVSTALQKTRKPRGAEPWEKALTKTAPPSELALPPFFSTKPTPTPTEELFGPAASQLAPLPF